MKNKFLLLGLILAFVACNDLTDLNIDKKNPFAVPGETLFTSAQKNLVDQMVSTNVNFNIFRLIVQQWTETTYTDEANYDFATRAIPFQHWDELYRRTLANFKESAKIIATDEAVADEQIKAKNNRLAIIEVMEVYTYSVLVESFGNIPYSEALNIDILTPKYDDGLTVYKDLIARLNTAIGTLDGGFGSFNASADNIYGGDTQKWIAFANSLKLRMGMTIADVASEAALAKSTVESAAANAIGSNADNAAVHYLSSTPNTNPLYVDLVASGRQDFIGANTFVDKLNALNDPRRQFFFQHNNVDIDTTPAVEEYLGGTYGENSIFSQFSNVSYGTDPGNFALLEPTYPGTIMSAAEVHFLLAEAAARGYNVSGTAEEHYNEGITSSIEEWGGSQADADAYLANPDVAYATAAGTWQEKIGTQAWIALYNRGFEAWGTWRRLDYPELTAPPEARSGVPTRLPYPIQEQTLNGDQYHLAATAIGGDEADVKLFFDVH
ncbi:MAG: SusD/RagB family nutrient-binding outer membrane lipoprotein [Saprospiraceae bacterium]|uniref:SusD/RagB family nutrient-binding outer membrane lipoprotein n=1 Tax=Candidatus Opimibacter skivensis TaxID=2982028 RepID=A0A9D7XT87_9BACT|nr:SusD/RagB family nutrient-binding outer membrane lipoprotein [Candidatus Opimibacter skivensis]